MTTIQKNAELFRMLSIIAEDELLSAKLMRYIKKLTASKQDSAQMTKEEFLARVDESKEDAKSGKVFRVETKEGLSHFLNNL